MERKIVELLLSGKGIQKTATELKVGKVKVRAVRAKAVQAGYLSRLVPVPEYPLPLFPDEIDRRSLRTSQPDQALLKQKTWIEDNLRSGWKPITVYEELKIPGISRASFYRFLERHSLDELAHAVEKDSFTPPIRHEPGEALILDWGKMKDVIDPLTNKKRTLWAFVGVLGFSRYMMIHLVWSNDIPTTLQSIEKMLREIGGVPKKITSDNPKCFSVQADMHDPVLNPAFMRFSQHYDFTIECLPPRDPKKKGKVERLMPFARRLFEAYSKTWTSIEHAQEYLNQKVHLANQRIHGTTRLKPLIVFLEREASALKSLPALCFESEEIAYPKVRKDGFVRFQNKYYAVGENHDGEEAMILATQSRVSIYCRGQLQEVYDRIQCKYETHAIKDHLLKPWQKIEENNAHYLRNGRKIGPHAEEFIRAVLQRGNGFVDTRIIWGFLSLEKKYPADKLNQAAADALEMGRLSSRFVESLLKLQKGPESKSKSSPETQSNNSTVHPAAPHKFVRPMSVYTEQLKLFN